MAVNKKPPNPARKWEKSTPIKLKANLLIIASKAKTTPHPGRIQAIWKFWELWNSNQETGEWDKRVDKKPPNPIGNWGGKPTSRSRAALTKGSCSTGLE